MPALVATCFRAIIFTPAREIACVYLVVTFSNYFLFVPGITRNTNFSNSWLYQLSVIWKQKTLPGAQSTSSFCDSIQFQSIYSKTTTYKSTCSVGFQIYQYQSNLKAWLANVMLFLFIFYSIFFAVYLLLNKHTSKCMNFYK